MNETVTTRRQGGRAGRRALRESGPPARVVEPGLSGGMYAPLSKRDMERIHHTALEVLANVGMADPTPEVLEKCLEKGCLLDDRGRLCFPRPLVEDVITNACREFVLHSRGNGADLVIGGDRVYFATSGEAVTMLDDDSGEFRPSTIVDLYDAARLADRLEHIHKVGQTVVATDIEDRFEHAMSISYACLAGTAKVFGVSFDDAEHVASGVAMFDMVLGGEGRFLERPFCTIGCCPVVSPLRFAEDSLDVMVETIRLGMIGDVAVAPQAAATAPAPLAGTLVQVVAEALAILVVANLFRPGVPVYFGAWPFVADLRTGSFAAGGEAAILMAAAGQMSRFYDLPNSAAAMSDAKVPDNQAGYEKGIAATLVAMSGTNSVGEALGMVASLIGCSFESMVIDNEMVGMIQRTLRGIEVTDDTLSYEVIREVALGTTGHYLSHPQTLAVMESEYLYPVVGDRTSPAAWLANDRRNIADHARQRVRQVLSSHYPQYIEPKVDAAIRERFPIRLAREDMRPECGRW